MDKASILVLILGAITIIKTLLEVYKGVRNPNVEQDKNLLILKNSVNNNTQNIQEIKKDLHEIKNNHLSHIWNEINKISKAIVRIEEKLKK